MSLRPWCVAAFLLIGFVCSRQAALSQKKSVRPGINKSFQKPDVKKFVERFEREGREVYLFERNRLGSRRFRDVEHPVNTRRRNESRRRGGDPGKPGALSSARLRARRLARSEQR